MCVYVRYGFIAGMHVLRCWIFNRSLSLCRLYVWLEQIHDNNIMIAVQFYVSSYYHGFQNYRELLVEISNAKNFGHYQYVSCDSCR